MLTLLALQALAGVPDHSRGATFVRPTLSGPVQTLDSADGFFRVHYTDEGADAIPGRDDDGNGVADYPERVIAALELGRDAFVADGWRAPVGDLGEGGSTALDVYLYGVDINGYAYALDGQAAEGGYACYIEIDPTLATAGLILESVAIHELHHCVEYRYGLSASWVHEGSATAEQYATVTDLGLALAVNVLWDVRLSAPELAMDDRTGRYEYASMAFFKYWSDVVAERRAFWESLAEAGTEDWRVHADAAARDAGRADFAELFLDHQVYNAFACGLDDGGHYVADSLACTSGATVPVEPIAGRSFRSDHVDNPYTTTFHELAADGSTDAVAVDCTVETGAIGLAVIAVDGDGVGGQVATSWEGSARLDRALDPEGSARIVVTSIGDEPARVDCVAERIAPVPEPETETPGCGCHTAPGLSLGFVWLVPLALRRRRT